MEIDREQVIKDLEWKKLASSRMGSVTVSAEQFASYYTLIKELTEENERLRKQCGEIIVECDERDFERLKQVAELTAENERLKSVEFTCGFVKPHKVLECPIFDEISKARADVVREIFDAIDEIAYSYLNDADYSCGDMIYDLNELKNKWTEDAE